MTERSLNAEIVSQAAHERQPADRHIVETCAQASTRESRRRAAREGWRSAGAGRRRPASLILGQQAAAANLAAEVLQYGEYAAMIVGIGRRPSLAKTLCSMALDGGEIVTTSPLAMEPMDRPSASREHLALAGGHNRRSGRSWW